MRALIVDDEPLALECALTMIDWAAEGVRHVNTARSAAQAKELLARDGADILLCDIEMPGGSGLELVEWVRRQDITAQVILLTAHGDFSYAQRAVGLGCLGYLLKPIDPEELRESLRGAIQIVRQQRSYARYREDSERWLRNKPVMAELFWQKLAQAPAPPGPKELAALQERCGTDYPDAAAVFPLLCRVLTGSSQEGGEQVKREISAALFSLCDEIVFLPLSGGALPALCIGKGGLTLRSSALGPRKSRACARPCTASGWPSFWTAPAAPGRSGQPWTGLSCWTGRTSGERQAYSPPGNSRISPAAGPAPTSSSGPG